MQVHPVGHPAGGGQTTSLRSAKAETVRFIHQQQGPVSPGQVRHGPQRGTIAIHAENPLSNHKRATGSGKPRRRPDKALLQLRHIIVPETADRGPAGARAVDQAGVGEPVHNGHVARPEHCAQRAHGRGMPAAEAQGRFGAFDGRQCFLQLAVRREGAADEPGRSGASSVFFHGGDHGFDHQRMGCQA